MGWCCDSGEHEGFLVGLVEERTEGGSVYWRELSYFTDEGRRETIRLRCVQVACDCGWRSPRIVAPYGTTWAPHSVAAPSVFEDQARAVWKEHVARFEQGLPVGWQLRPERQ